MPRSSHTVFRLLFVCLLFVPVVEIYLFIRVGSAIGPLRVAALCVLTAMIGTILVRKQGIQTARRVQNKIQCGEIPATDLIEGLILLASGILLLTPGFFTDLAGFLCLLPATRAWIAGTLLSRMQRQQGWQRTDQSVVIVEGECWEENGELLERRREENSGPG